MKIKKQNKKKIALILLGISTFFILFNNAGQFLTFVNIPFSKTSQIYVGIAGLIFSFIWYSYLEGAIK